MSVFKNGAHLKHIFCNLHKHFLTFQNKLSRNKHSKNVVLGIETSCDDTGCAVMDDTGTIFGESIHSQTQIHLEFGGILPIIAKEMHEENIDNVVNEALHNANMGINDVDAVAVTTKPGLKSSLYVGTNYGKKLCLESGKPFIPIHHMQAHALTSRIVRKVEFPFLVLLISGGHCLLSVAQSPVKFLLLGYSMSDSPGEAFDKVARRLKLRLIPEYKHCCGGEAIEKAAARGNPEAIRLTVPLLQYRDCNFSFSGMKQGVRQHIINQERKHEIVGAELLPDVYDLCASFLHTVTIHLCHRVHRAMLFVRDNNLIPKDKQTLVVSGGVACNNYIKQGLDILSTELGYKLIVPPPKLCMDNGVMIAWNGVEKLRLQHDIVQPDMLDTILVEPRCGMGEDISKAVAAANIKVKIPRLEQLYKNRCSAETKKNNEASTNSVICH